MLARPSLENLISLWAPRANIGRATFAAALRAALDDEDEIACIVVRFLGGKEERRRDEIKTEQVAIKNFAAKKNLEARDVWMLRHGHIPSPKISHSRGQNAPSRKLEPFQELREPSTVVETDSTMTLH